MSSTMITQTTLKTTFIVLVAQLVLDVKALPLRSSQLTVSVVRPSIWVLVLTVYRLQAGS